MITSASKRLIVSIVWCAGLALAVALLIAGPIVFLRSGKSRVALLMTEIEGKENELRSYPVSPEYASSLKDMEAALDCWHAMTENEASRLAELSSVAHASGTTITALQTLEMQTSTDGRVVFCPYRLNVRGRCDQLADFCDGLYAARGLAAIREVAIEPAREPAEPGLLQASVQVAWYGQSSAARDGRQTP